MHTKVHWEVKVILKADHQLLFNPKWSYLETPWGIYWPSAWFSIMIRDWFQITTMHLKLLLGVKIIPRPCYQLLINPQMIIFGDPKGYLLTFGTVSYDARRLISNHSYALEMIYGGHNHSYNLSIIAWKPKIIIFGDPKGIYIDLCYPLTMSYFYFILLSVSYMQHDLVRLHLKNNVILKSCHWL